MHTSAAQQTDCINTADVLSSAAIHILCALGCNCFINHAVSHCLSSLIHPLQVSESCMTITCACSCSTCCVCLHMLCCCRLVPTRHVVPHSYLDEGGNNMHVCVLLGAPC